MPSVYPEAGGVALILYGANGNIYYQFSDPAGAFVGFQNNGSPAAFRGNPFTINSPLTLDCGVQNCNTYFGGQIVKMEVRFTALDGDTHAAGFDFNDISLLINGTDIGNWSTIPTQNTNTSGTTLISSQLGFGQNTYDTGWFSTTNTTLLADILTSQSIRTQVFDRDPNDNFWDFRRGNSLSNPGLARVAPAYTLNKRARSGSFTGPDITTFSAVGQTIYYTYDVRNVGSVRIDNLTVNDDRLGVVNCTPNSVAVGATATCRASHNVTQAEFDTQNITNIAQATGQPEFGQLGTLSDTVALTGPGRTPSISLVKTPKGGTYSASGNSISYTFVARNTGNVTLTSVAVTDPLIPGLNCTRASLAPNATLTCSASYSVNQTDVDNGSIVNTANVTSRDPANTAINAADTATNTAQQSPAFSVDKSTTTTPTAAGQTLDYRFAVRNDGNVSIRSVTPTDAKCASAIVLSSGDADGDTELDVGETHVFTCTSVAVTQAEVDAGSVDNAVSVAGTPAGGSLPPATDTLSTPIARSSGFTIAKSTSSTPTQAGQTLNYSFVVGNTGNASISSVAVTDAKCAATPALQSGDGDNDTELDPSETWIYTCTSVAVTQAEVDAGQVDNTASVSGTSPGGGTVSPASDTLSTPITPAPSFTVVKSTTSTPALAGDRLTYSFLLTNTGNVTINGPALNDAKCSSSFTLASGDTDSDAALDVGEAHTYTCLSVPVTQAEVDAGSVDNTVAVTGTPSGGTLPPATGGTSTPITSAPALALDKRLNPSSPTSFDDGTAPDADVLLFDFVVTNTGNVTLTDQIVISDVLLDAPASCPAPGAGLAPMTSITCTGQRTIQQGDIDAGQFQNTATASSGGTTSPSDTVTVPASQLPALTVDKTATEPAAFAPGQVVNYSYLITNSGNTTIPDSATIAVSDNRTAVSCPAITPTGIAPGGTLTCTASYTITNADIDIGTVTNTATATDGNVTSPTDSATVPANFSPAISLTKTADPLPAGPLEAGDQITYVYTVQNTGGVSFGEIIQVTDNKINGGAPFNCWVPGAAGPNAALGATLDPDPAYPGATPPSAPTSINGETATCPATYTVMQEDIDRGFVTNEAVANTVFAPGGANVPVASEQVNETVTLDLPASMTVDKTATPADLTPAVPGDIITYQFTLTNTGEVTLDDLAPVDSGPLFGGVVGSNALSTFTVVTGPDGNTDGRVDTLAPDGIAVVTATYTLTQQDIDNAAAAGDPATAIANSATATATPRNGTLATVPPSTATTGFAPQPAFVATKSTSSSPTAAGDTLAYEFFVDNTGNVSISGVTLADLKCAAAPALQSGDLDSDTELDVDETWRYTCVSVAVTQAEVDAGAVDNTVTVNGTPAGGTLPETTASNSTPITPDGSLVVTKSTTSVPTVAGQTLDYSFVVTNSGNVSVTPTAVTDPKCAATPVLVSGDDNTDSAVNPSETWSYSCTSIAVTQAEIDAGVVRNSVSVSGSTPGGDPITPPTSDVATPVTAAPVYSVTKATTSVPTGAGQTLEYTFTVENDGNVSISNLIVSDDKCGTMPMLQSGDANTDNALDPTETFVFSCTSIPVTQAELDSGSVDNDVSIGGNQPDGTPLTPETDTLSTSVSADPSWVLTKSSVSTPTAAGDTLEYDFILNNTGNVSISTIAIVDTKCSAAPALNAATDAGGDGILSPNEIWSLSCTSIPVTQAEIDAGQIDNSATASGTPTGGTLAPAPATNTTTVTSAPAIAITKSSASTPAVAGDTLIYDFALTNTGNTSLMAVVITDAKCAAPATLQSGDTNSDTLLNPTETWAYSCTSIPVTQAEIDAGEVLNTASVVAQDPAGGNTPSVEASSRTVVAEAGAFSVVKSTSSMPAAAGDTLDYLFNVSNDGNVSIGTVAVTDAKCAAAPTLQSGDTNNDNQLNPTENWVYACTSVAVTQAEIDAGQIDNSASVSGTAPGGDPLTPASDTNTVGVAPTPSIEAIKTITSTGISVGDTVAFRIAVRNTGNVTLTGINLTDTLTRTGGAVLTLSNPIGFASADQGSAAGTLLPNETAIYTAGYVLTQADLDAGGLSNTATATGSPPTGAPVSDISDDGIPGNGADNPTLLDIPAQPALGMVKSLIEVIKADASTAASFDAVGDRLEYLFTVTNTGTVTITDAITITDPLITDAGGTITCDPVPLAPTETLECRGSYVIVQDDINTGQVDNAATATDGTTTSPLSEITVNAVQTPEIAITKTAQPLPPAQFIVGATVAYDYVATNTGNVTLTTPIAITDNLISAANITCDAWPGTLEPGATYACVGTYTVTSDDVDLGVVTNLASGTNGTTSSPQVSESIPDAAIPALSIVKTSADTSFAAVGDVLTYDFEITNSGQRAFVRPITVIDNRIGTITCWEPEPVNDPDFIAGEMTTCSAPYSVTQADLDRGSVTNEAFAQTTFGTGTTVVSAPGTLTIDAAANPAMDLQKTAALPAGRTTQTLIAGDVLRYTLSLRNAGNQTLRAIQISDPRLSLTCTIAQLDPTVTDTTCQGDYTLTQADIDAGSIVNDAAATGSDPSGQAIGDTATLTTPLPTPTPGLTLLKTANVNPFGAVGSTIVYAFAVENTGNVTLRDIEVTDPRVPGYVCSIASLLPQEENTACTVPYMVTQDDVDAGTITNTATAVGNDPSGTPVPGSGQATTPGPTAVGSLDATKTFSTDGTTEGSTVTFTVTVANIGNVTLTDVVPVDVLSRITGELLALNAPGLSFVSGDGDGDSELDVDEVWTYTGTYTLVQDDINSGGISNVVDVTANDPNNNVVSDRADNGIDGDGNTQDDPTVFEILSGPAIEGTKVVSTPGTMAGDVVVFDISLRNLGNVDLQNIGVVDQLTRLDGTSLTPTSGPTFVSGDTADIGILNLPETWVYQVTYELTQEDVDAGGLSNMATVSGDDFSSNTVDDVADNGIDNDGNTSDDPTVLTILPTPGFEVRKTVATAAAAVDETVTFLIEVENTGNVTLNAVALTDQLSRADGTLLTLATGPTFTSATTGSNVGRLLPGGVAQYSATYVVVQEDIDAGGLSNTAIGTAGTPGGATVTDTSDDPTAPGTGPSDPTVLPLAQLPSLVIEKSVVSERTLFPTVYEVSFDITVQNDGNTTLTEVQVTDDLAAFAAPSTILSADFPTTVSVTGLTAGNANASYDGVGNNNLLDAGATLAPGTTATIRVTTTYSTAAGFPSPGQNAGTATTAELPQPEQGTVIATSVDTDGDGVPDDIESPTDDRDRDGIPDAADYDPTGYFYCEDNGRILPGGLITVTGGGLTQTGVGINGPINIVRDGSTGEYQFFITRAGTYTLSYTQPPNATPSTTITATPGPTDVTNLVDVLTGTTTTNPRILGSGEFGASGALTDFSPAANPAFYTTFTFEAGDPFVFSNNIPFRNCAATGELVATKAVIGRTDVRLGDLVTYQLGFDLVAGAVDLRDVTFADVLPMGISYVPGTSAITRGAAAAVPLEPAITGRSLTWANEMLPAGTRTVITFSGRVGPNAPTGNLTNQTIAQGPTGVPLSNRATAVVRRVPEHVFDCSDVIGKVFDDRNRNGYQDGPTSQSATVDQTEPGLPGVRIATVNGTLITTDEFGRFHVPCAELPRKEGTNFILKVDERSLPSGYRLTTENPRVVRLTAGKFAKMNFGASLGRVIDINLSGAAFGQGIEPSAKLRDAVRNLSRTLRKEPSIVRLSYAASTDAEVKLGRARMREVEKLLRQEWRRNGTYKLTIEKTVWRDR